MASAIDTHMGLAIELKMEVNSKRVSKINIVTYLTIVMTMGMTIASPRPQ